MLSELRLTADQAGQASYVKNVADATSLGCGSHGKCLAHTSMVKLVHRRLTTQARIRHLDHSGKVLLETRTFLIKEIARLEALLKEVEFLHLYWSTLRRAKSFQLRKS